MQKATVDSNLWRASMCRRVSRLFLAENTFRATNLDKLHVGESSDVEVWRVLLRRDAVVELGVAAADGERLGAVCAAQGGRAVQPAEVGGRAELCEDTNNTHTHTHFN